MDQLIIIIKVLGSPKGDDLDFITDSQALDYIKCLPKKKGINFKEIYPMASKKCLSFLKGCLKFNPNQRLSVKECVEHPLFEDIRNKKLENIKQEEISNEYEHVDIKNESDLRQLFVEQIMK